MEDDQRRTAPGPARPGARPDAVRPGDGQAAALDAVAPGPLLASVLAALDLDAADDGALVEVVAAAARLEGWARAAGARAAAALSRRESMNPAWSAAAGGAPTVPCVAGDELAMRLGCSRRTGTRLVEHGKAFTGALVDTGAALAQGQISTTTAGMIADRLAPLPVQVALAVQDRVLPTAGGRTPTQIARDLSAALIIEDPGEAVTRVRRACAGRRVDRPRALPDGVAGLWAVLPAGVAARIDATLDAAARSARSAGDPRTLDQLRADGLSDLVLHTACTTGSAAGVTPAADAETAPLAAPTTGTTAAEPVAGAREPVAGSAVPAAGAGADDDPWTGCLTSARSRAHVRVTVALSTLLGLDEQPGDLAGYGPIDATTARALAEGGIWRRLVTDPQSGTVLDVGRTRYRPPAGMVAHVTARDRTCARPGCSTPAESCDLDHTIEYHPGAAASPGARAPSDAAGDAAPDASAPALGRTAVDNLGPLCRRDHRLKTDGGYTLRQPEPGVFEWTSRTGHRYRVTPGAAGRTERLAAAPASTPPRPPTRAGGDAPPPF